MAKVVVTKSKLDSLAQHINTKAGTTGAKTIAQMQATVDGISGGAAKETWIIKSSATGGFATTQIAFTSNGQKFTSIGAYDSTGFAMILYYDSYEVAGYDPRVGGVYEFDSEAYRKLTFDAPPTGELLTWLQANGVKQPDDTAVQDTKALTITSNGTVSVTPDAPYDALKKVDVTVDVISTKMAVTWHQCPEAVRNYLANVTYDPSDYSNSQIANYAPATPVAANTKPIGKTVGGVTYYNEVPNVETPFSADSAAGTLKPLDALRWINTPRAPNVRDLGGWPCDGGTIKYGLLYRGGEVTSEDRSVLVGQLGIRHDLDLRGTAEANLTSSPLGSDVYYTCAPQYAWYALTPVETWVINLRTVFDAVTHGEPVYFHCLVGADRTGTLACVLEALLGVSQSNIDKDYELTCFYTGTGTDAIARRRNESDWTGLISAINALPGSTFRDKVVGWVATLGFTAEEINAFRAAMIDGTPETVMPSVNTYTVTNTLTNATSDNSAASATEYQPYTAKIAPANGYVISSVQVKMGGADVTGSVWRGTQTVLRHKVTVGLTHCTSDNSRTSVIDGQGYAATLAAELGYTLEGATISITMGGVDVSTFYKDGVIAIPNVTGDLVITVTAVKQAQENMFPAHFFDTDGTTVFGNGKGYENGYRFGSDGGVRDGATGRSITGYLDVSGYTKMVVSGSTVGSMQGGYPVVWYDSSRAVLSKGGAYETTSVPNGTWDIPSGANYVRLSCGLDPVDMVVNLE